MSNASVLQMGPKRNTTFVQSDYAIGNQLYAAGELIDACGNPEQLRGFRASLNAEADAGTGFWLESHRHVNCDEEEYRYIRQ